jgi:hypothetical protein
MRWRDGWRWCRSLLRLNKAISMLGMQASGLHAGPLVEGVGTPVHASITSFEKSLRDPAHRVPRPSVTARWSVSAGPMGPRPPEPGARARKEEPRRRKVTGWICMFNGRPRFGMRDPQEGAGERGFAGPPQCG